MVKASMYSIASTFDTKLMRDLITIVDGPLGRIHVYRVMTGMLT